MAFKLHSGNIQNIFPFEMLMISISSIHCIFKLKTNAENARIFKKSFMISQLS